MYSPRASAHSTRAFLYWTIVLCGMWQVLPAWGIADEQPIRFSHQIANILLENCIACHGPKKSEGGYRVDSFEMLLKPGDSGTPTQAAGGSTQESSKVPPMALELLRRIQSADESERMPPDSDPLDAKQVELIQKWVESGAVYDGAHPSAPLTQIVPPKEYTPAPKHYPVAIPVSALSFVPNEPQVVVGGYHELTVWNIENGKLERRISNVGERVHCIVPLPDSEMLAVGCGEPGIRGEVRIFDFKTGTLEHVLVRAKDLILDIAPRPNAAELAIASADGLLRIVDWKTKSEIRSMASHADSVTCVAWSEDGKRLASGSRDKSVKIYDADSGEMIGSYTGHSAAVRSIRFMSDGKEILSASADQKTHRWQIDGLKKVAEWNLQGEAFRMIRNGNHAWISNSNKQIQQIDLDKNQLGLSIAGHSDWVLCLGSDTKSQMLASGSIDGEVRIWNASDGSLKNSWVAKP